jgi:hypothetical protein
MAGADLRCADLCDADLAGADLRGASLAGADLHGANLTSANLANVDLSRANLLGVIGLPEAPVVAGLNGKIDVSSLNMPNWHSSCGTVHCRAAWAVHLAGEAGYELERRLGTSAAGALITIASCPSLKGRVPDWHASNKGAAAEIRALAAIGE